MLVPLPAWAVELVNGWLALMLPWVIWTAVRYLHRRRAYYDSFRTFYRSNKMAISLLCLFTGLEIRTLVGWITRHASLHNDPGVYGVFATATSISVPLFLFGGALMVIGAVCWGRVASDMPLTRPSIWLATLGSFTFSAWFALWSPW